MARTWARRLAKIGGYGIVVLLGLAALALTFTVGWRPVIGAKKRPLTTRKFESTPERLRRGDYLVNAVMHCMGCHSKYGDANPPVLLSKPGAGDIFFAAGGFRIVAPNITSDPGTGIGNWSDDAIARAIREGIAADGSALVPVMPYEHFSHLSDEDLASIVVFLRTLPPVHNELPLTKIPFLFARLIQAAPQPLTEPVAEPDLSTSVKRGAYLAEMGTCAECHTPRNPKFQPIAGMEMAGGNSITDESGQRLASSANLTPDASGIGYYDEALFIQTMRTGAVRARQLNGVMPWWIFRNMTDDDLKAVFAYLRSLKPVHHLVDNTEPPTQCKLCGQKHGLGDRN
jgi:mono/diheme cytochrome c family protein